jgi:hypothetical protein
MLRCLLAMATHLGPDVRQGYKRLDNLIPWMQSIWLQGQSGQIERGRVCDVIWPLLWAFSDMRAMPGRNGGAIV